MDEAPSYIFENWDPFEYFRTNLDELQTPQFNQLLANLKISVRRHVGRMHYDYDESEYEESYPVQFSGFEMKMGFTNLFYDIIRRMESFWDPVTSQLDTSDLIADPDLNPDEVSTQFTVEPGQENVDAYNLLYSFQIVLQRHLESSKEELPLLLIKAKNGAEIINNYKFETDVLCGYLEILGKKWDRKELYGLLADSRNIEFFRYDYTQGRNAFKSSKVPFTIRGFLKETEESKQMENVIRVCICIIREALQKLGIIFRKF